MTTDNRTNEPTPEQVEVAAVASINSHRSRAGLPTLATLDGVPNADEWRDDARAALVAAQGAAPQAESAAAENALDLLEHLRVSGQIDYEDYSTMHDHITSIAPVQPSSTVDEALGMIDRTLDSISEFGTTWQHHEVVRMLNDIRGALAGKEKNDE